MSFFSTNVSNRKSEIITCVAKNIVMPPVHPNSQTHDLGEKLKNSLILEI